MRFCVGDVLFAPEAEADFAALVSDETEAGRRDAAHRLGARLFEVIDKLGRAQFAPITRPR